MAALGTLVWVFLVLVLRFITKEKNMRIDFEKTPKRLGLLILYCVASYLSFMLIYKLAHARYGNGVRGLQIPLAVLYSWGALILNPAPFIACLIYPAAIYLLNPFFHKLFPLAMPIIPFAFHAVGSGVALIRIYGTFAWDIAPHMSFILLCYLASVPVAFLFISADWHNIRVLAGEREKGMYRTRGGMLFLAIIVCVLLLGVYDLVGARAKESKFSKVKEGMNEKEITHLLGTPLILREALPGELKNEVGQRFNELRNYIYEFGFLSSSGASLYFNKQSGKLVHYYRLRR